MRLEDIWKYRRNKHAEATTLAGWLKRVRTCAMDN